MKATEAKFLDFLKKSSQFIIPIYQRTYSWTESECQQLWDDIIRTGESNDVSAHFVGSVVYIEKGLYQVSSQSPLLVIDGQQRLTTVSLILEALACSLGDSEPMDGFSSKKIRNYYLLNPLEDGESRYKLLLTQTDKNTMLALVDQGQPPADHSLRITENFDFFKGKIQSLDGDLETLCKGLAKLVIVDISLNRDQDNPQLIFESMNSTGRELSQADLIRNFILMGLEPSHQTKLYNDHWRPMELAFGQEAYREHFDGFMRHYLTLKTGDIPKIRDVYKVFKSYTNQLDFEHSNLDTLVADIHQYADHYCAMVFGNDASDSLTTAFADLRELKVDVTYPLLLELYNDYATNKLDKDDFEQIVRYVESYIFRRAICKIPAHSHNKTFTTFGRTISKDNYLESVKAQFLILPSYRRFPDDEEFRRDLSTRDIYNSRRVCSHLLRMLENHNRKELVSVLDYTIEHILPQNDNLSKQWQKELGEDWKQIQEAWLHTLGNLTLTGYNSEYSDKPFLDKRDIEGGFAMSPLKLNKDLITLDHWNAETIQNRALGLTKTATDVWRVPFLDSNTLDQYRAKPKAMPVYSIETHKKLTEDSPMRPLFDALRKEVLALDECVVEEFLKKYVAYKAETNFVDVVPQVRALRLSLNMPFHEITDPRGICKDISNIGRWGNGDVEVSLKSTDDLPYVMGLIRQAYERQMDAEEVQS